MSDVRQARFIPKIYDFDEEHMAFIMEALLGVTVMSSPWSHSPACGESP